MRPPEVEPNLFREVLLHWTEEDEAEAARRSRFSGERAGQAPVRRKRDFIVADLRRDILSAVVDPEVLCRPLTATELDESNQRHRTAWPTTSVDVQAGRRSGSRCGTSKHWIG